MAGLFKKLNKFDNYCSDVKISCMRSTILEKLNSKGISRRFVMNRTRKKAMKDTNRPITAKRIVWTARLIFSSLPAERMKVIPPKMI
tara:strand:- start:34 stop:294 length:261 start_codon:yes stop_codon:yes gene_type:complete